MTLENNDNLYMRGISDTEHDEAKLKRLREQVRTMERAIVDLKMKIAEIESNAKVQSNNTSCYDREKCQSCGMPIEAGPYCAHCIDENGQLQDFDTRFERMVAWAMRRGGDREKAERDTLDYMATLPAWADHPELARRRAR